MRILLFAPYGLLTEETKVLTVYAWHLRKTFHQVNQLLCNGIFSLCDRDIEFGWSRNLRSCIRCIGDQKKISTLLQGESIEFSKYITPEDMQLTQCWITALAKNQLEKAEYLEIPLYNLVMGTIRHKYGMLSFSELVDKDESFIRRVYLVSARCISAAQSLVRQNQYDMALIAGGDDVISKSFMTALQKVGIQTAAFRWDLGMRAVIISHSQNETRWKCDIHCEFDEQDQLDSLGMSKEEIEHLSEISEFLGISTGQMVLF